MIIRPLRAEDAGELAALVVENREFLAPFEPVRDEDFFTVDGQRERIESDRSQAFAILAGDRIAGTVTISNIDYGPFQSANLGYWVAERLSGRGLATKAVGEVTEIAFRELGFAPTRGCDARRQPPLAARPREERLRADRPCSSLPPGRWRVARSSPLSTNGGLIA